LCFFFFQAEDGIRDFHVTGVQTCALPISRMIISFLASHGGSSARALITAMREGNLQAKPGIVVTNNRDSAIFHWCLDNDIEVRQIGRASCREGEEIAVDDASRGREQQDVS